MWGHLELLANDFRFIFLKKRGIRRPWRLFFLNLRIKFMQQCVKRLKLKRTKEKFLGLTVIFPDYGTFAALWREIFILENYYFACPVSRPVIFDVGANIGMAVCYFKLLFPDASITAFEPDPKAYQWLCKNIALNGFSGVTVHNVAVTKHDGETTFYVDMGAEASLGNSTHPDLIRGEKKAIKVPAQRLSSFIKGPVDFLKIDAEGGEYDIIPEIKDKLAFVRRLVVELHQGYGPKNDPWPQLLGILDDAGFRYSVTSGSAYHHGFVASPTDAYAILVDATRLLDGVMGER